MKYRGEFDSSEVYVRGDTVRRNGKYFVFNRGWHPTAAPADPSMRGLPGRDGRHGIDGETIVGARGPKGDSIKGDRGERGAGFNWRGRYSVGVTYSPGDVCQWDGSSWVCREETTRRPAKGPHWDLMAAAGQQGYSGQRGASGADGTSSGEASIPAEFDGPIEIGAPVYVSGDGHVAAARANDIATSYVVGLCNAAGRFVSGGVVERSNWTPITGSVWLTPGATYFLSTSLGMLTTTAPSAEGECYVVCGVATGLTTIRVECEPPIVRSGEHE